MPLHPPGFSPEEDPFLVVEHDHSDRPRSYPPPRQKCNAPRAKGDEVHQCYVGQYRGDEFVELVSGDCQDQFDDGEDNDDPNWRANQEGDDEPNWNHDPCGERLVVTHHAHAPDAGPRHIGEKVAACDQETGNPHIEEVGHPPREKLVEVADRGESRSAGKDRKQESQHRPDHSHQDRRILDRIDDRIERGGKFDLPNSYLFSLSGHGFVPPFP